MTSSPRKVHSSACSAQIDKSSVVMFKPRAKHCMGETNLIYGFTFGILATIGSICSSSWRFAQGQIFTWKKESWGTIWIREYKKFNPFQVLDKFYLIYNNINKHIKPQLCARPIKTLKIPNNQYTDCLYARCSSDCEKDRQVIRATWRSMDCNKGSYQGSM